MIANKRPSFTLGFIAFAVGCLFLCNANLNMIDFFPDIIGYVIICVALRRLADLNEEVAKAQKQFAYMMLVEAAKLASIIWLFGLQDNDTRNTGMLLLSFVFAVVDCLLLISAFRNLFSGFITLGYAHSNTAFLGRKKEEGRSHTEKIRSFTIFFIIFKESITVLPEFSNLTSYQYDESSGLISLYEFIGLMRAMSFIAVTAVGIIWIIKLFRYFIRVDRDTVLCDSLKERYVTDVLPRTSIFIKRGIKRAFLLFVLTAILILDFRIEYVNVIPDFLAAVAFAVGFAFVQKYLTVKKPLVWGGASFFFAANLASTVAERYFFDKYYYGAVFREESAYLSYTVMRILCVISTVAALLLCALLVYVLYDIIKNHTGFVYGRDAETDARKLKETHKKISRKLIFIIVGAILSAAGEIFYTFFRIRFNFCGAVSAIATLIFVVSVIKVTMDIVEEVETKYMLE